MFLHAKILLAVLHALQMRLLMLESRSNGDTYAFGCRCYGAVQGKQLKCQPVDKMVKAFDATFIAEVKTPAGIVLASTSVGATNRLENHSDKVRRPEVRLNTAAVYKLKDDYDEGLIFYGNWKDMGKFFENGWTSR
jgi:hypothetical protein